MHTRDEYIHCALLSLAVAYALVVRIIHAEGIRLENFDYPFSVEVFELESQQQPLEMVYMDVKARGGRRGRDAKARSNIVMVFSEKPLLSHA